jgi:hypothetical protein
MFSAMIVKACAERVPAGSEPSAVFIAARTSGGRSVEVRTMSCSTLSKKEGSISEQYTGLVARRSRLVARAASDERRATRGEQRETSNEPMPFRTEHDPLGDLQVPADAYYGVQTARAVENFPISGLRAHGDLITATIMIKKAAAQTNAALGRLDAAIAGAIVAAADEILTGALRDQFVVDVYQAGAGTSHNMNANEVLANRAAEILGGARGSYDRVHPNDHVNMGQSTNDVYPTATRLALLLGSAGLVASARRAGRRPRSEGHRVCPHSENRTHPPAGRRPDYPRPGIFGIRRVRSSRRRRCRPRSAATVRAEHRRYRGRYRLERGRRLSTVDRRTDCQGDRARGQTRRQPVSGDAKHGRRPGVLKRIASTGRGSGQDRQRSAAAVDGPASRHC